MFAALILRLAPYKLLFEILIIGSIVAGAVYEVHCFLDYEQNIGYQRAVSEYTAKQLIKEEAARAVEAQLRQQLQEAQNARDKRDAENEKLLIALGNTSNGLRNTVANIRTGVPTATIDALRKTTDTLATVFEDCRSEYAKMGQAASGHASDIKMMQDAWPK